MKCPSCREAEMVAAAEPYKYTESGLTNVTLVGIEVRSCPACGERAPVIPRILQLHEAIAHGLVNKRTRLSGAEVRFLRTYLGRSTDDFADVLGVTREHLSRWENDKAPIGGQADRLLRLIVVTEKPVRDYSVDSLGKIGDTAESEAMRLQRAPSGWTLAA